MNLELWHLIAGMVAQTIILAAVNQAKIDALKDSVLVIRENISEVRESTAKAHGRISRLLCLLKTGHVGSK